MLRLGSGRRLAALVFRSCSARTSAEAQPKQFDFKSAGFSFFTFVAGGGVVALTQSYTALRDAGLPREQHELGYKQYAKESHIANVKASFKHMHSLDYLDNPELEEQVSSVLNQPLTGMEGMVVIAGPKEIGKTSSVEHYFAEKGTQVLWVRAEDWRDVAKSLAPTTNNDADTSFVDFKIALRAAVGKQRDETRAIVVDDAQKLLIGKHEKSEWFDLLNAVSQYIRVVLIVSDRPTIGDFQKQSHWGSRLEVHYVKPAQLTPSSVEKIGDEHARKFKAKFMGDAPADVQKKAIELCGGSFGLYKTLKVRKCKTLAEFDANVSLRKEELQRVLDVVRTSLETGARSKFAALLDACATATDGVKVSAEQWETSVDKLVDKDILTPTRKFFVVAQDPIARQVIADTAKR